MVRIAIIGTGGMASTHAIRFNEIKGCKLVACSDTMPGRAAKFAEKHGIPSAYEQSEQMLKEEKIDGVSIAASDGAHCPVALQVIKHGIPVMCEKPLADNLKNARRMASAAKRKGLLTAVNFSYRNCAATQRAARLVADGKLGRIIHVEGSYLQSWLSSKVWGDWHTTQAWLWRLSIRHGSMGCLGDIGVHLYDLTTFIVGDISELMCELKTFDKGVKKIGEYVLDANDSFVSSVRFKNGAIGTLHSSRWATGHANTVALRVFGDKGALDLNLDRQPAKQLLGCIGSKAMNKAEWTPIKCPKTPNTYQRFITSIRTGKQAQTSFAVGAKVQSYLEHSMISDKQGKYVRVK